MMRDGVTKGGEDNGARGKSERVWCVCDSLLGIVESYHPSHARAMERIDREADFRPAAMLASVHEVQAIFSGQAYRVVTCRWDRPGTMLQVAGECPDVASRERLLHHAALNVGRSHHWARGEMRRLLLQSKPERRLPAHALDLPEAVAITSDDNRIGPIFSREEALQQAAKENRQYLAQGAAWSGHWCLVVEVSDPLLSTWVSSEFCGPLGVESTVLRRALRLVHPTAAEIARLATGDA